MQITIREPGSAITHFIGMMMAVFATIPLLVKTAMEANTISLASMSVFMLSMILLYGASATYHSINVSQKIITIFRKIDHMMIFILIAGSYTPVCLIVLGRKIGFNLFLLTWAIAILGIIIKGFWINCPKWFSSVLYIGMGWLCLLAFPQIIATLPSGGFYWLLAGGIIYTIGGIIYALKLPIFNSRHKNFGSHEIFHLFVMGGSLCHFICMYQYVASMPI